MMMMAANDMLPPIAVLPPVAMPNAAAEANHRVANHLQLLAALISVEARAISDPESRAVLERTQRRIAAVGGVHRQLYLAGGAEIDLGAYLEDLGEQLAASCPAHRRIVVDAQSVPVLTGTATSIGMLATELVTNACKHAFAVDQSGSIFVTLRRRPDGKHEFTVTDHGRGLRGDAMGTGLGSRLIDATVIKLGAVASFEDVCPGTRFRMIVRL